jgi:Predicted membrane protein
MWEKLKKLAIQAFKFGIVGVISTIIDFGLLYLFTEAFGIYYMVSAAASFIISLVFNYIASMKFVFHGKKDVSKKKEFLVFAVLSICGLIINELLRKACTDRIGMHYMLGKVCATVVVMIWNFVTRKLFIEDHSQ